MSKITIKDVASYSGVSLGTVSRVLNGKPDVHPGYIERVTEAVEALGYKRSRNTVKKSPSTFSSSPNKINTIGLLSNRFDNQQQMEDDQFDIAMIRGISNCLFENQTQLVFEPCKQLIQDDQLPQIIEKQLVDGAILKIDNTVNIPWIRRVAKILPTVLVGVTGQIEHCGIHSVLHDNYLAAYQAVEFLHDLGHRKIGDWAVTNDGSMPIYHTQRTQGYRRAFDLLGMKFDLALQQQPEHDMLHQPLEEVARESLKQWLKMGSNRPSAVICVSDSHALAMVQACHKLGLSVPKDMSIIGFMDMHIASICHPAITSVAFPNPETGRQAVRMLFEIQNNPCREVRHVVFGGKIIERKSHAKPYHL